MERLTCEDCGNVLVEAEYRWCDECFGTSNNGINNMNDNAEKPAGPVDDRYFGFTKFESLAMHFAAAEVTRNSSGCTTTDKRELAEKANAMATIMLESWED